MPPPADRLLRRVLVDEATGCWLWQGAKVGAGYGTIKVDGRTILTHRLAYELFVGPIPTALELDHLCRVPACVNPAHLEAVTHAENMRRGLAGFEDPGKFQRAKTHCSAGHPYDEANTRFSRMRNGNRQRRCGACERERDRERRHRSVA
jgi:hypothetical protein